jgi:hypothetical protein
MEQGAHRLVHTGEGGLLDSEYGRGGVLNLEYFVLEGSPLGSPLRSRSLEVRLEAAASSAAFEPRVSFPAGPSLPRLRRRAESARPLSPTPLTSAKLISRSFALPPPQSSEQPERYPL